MDVEWSAPPPVINSRDWEEIGRQLRDRPGQWARVAHALSASTSGSIAHQIRTGKYPKRGKGGRFDAKARKVDHKYLVFARWVPWGFVEDAITRTETP